MHFRVKKGALIFYWPWLAWAATACLSEVRPVAVPVELRVQPRPHRARVQRDLHCRQQQVVAQPALTVVEEPHAGRLGDDLLDTGADAIKHMVGL